MQLSWQLQKVLADHKLDKHGVLLRISRDARIHRSIVSNIYKDKASNVSLETLSKLCDWLHHNGVREDVLPGALIGQRPSDIWRALAAPGVMTIYLGEYQPPHDRSAPAFRWVSRRDTDVAAKIIARVSDREEVGSRSPRVELSYVPFHTVKGRKFTEDDRFGHDVAEAGKVCKYMRESAPISSAVLIGSQVVNYMVEHFVANLFKCRPFERSSGEQIVPFFRGYRETDPDLPSCLGGTRHPAGRRKDAEPGIYFRDKKNAWEMVKWRDGLEDAAVVITSYNSHTNAFCLVIFGYSGRGTAAAGGELALHPDKFWVNSDRSEPRNETAIHICRVQFVQQTLTDRQADPDVRDFEVVRRMVLQNQD